jgi:hypothetical protein
MTADEFKQIGREVFGTGWKKKMAVELGCHRNTVYKLANLKAALPDWVTNHVRLLDDKAKKQAQPHGGGE